MSLFGAGWTVGSLHGLLESGVAAATYYETTGMRGVIQGDEAPSALNRFPATAGMVFPLYHVFADLAEWKDSVLIASRSSDPLAVETLAVTSDGVTHLLLANLTPQPQTVTVDSLPAGDLTLRRLNADTAASAALDPLRFRAQTETLSAHGSFQVTLAPFEVTRLDAPQAPQP